MVAAFLFPARPEAGAQTVSAAESRQIDPGAQMRGLPFEYGLFAGGGFGASAQRSNQFFNLGLHAGKVLTAPGPAWLLHGQFEYAVEIMPLWQAYTPSFERANCSKGPSDTLTCTGLYGTGGVYSGVSVTPIILRWTLPAERRFVPWVQGAGGVVWTNHKFPPLGPYPTPGQQGTSVFNFTPQFGIGFHYFVRPHRSISFAANAVHISSASLGDSNPGVNASVQFSLGYTWWH